MWNPQDRGSMYRTIFPWEVQDAEHRLIQFENMDEDDAEADWNFDDFMGSDQPLVMSQRRVSSQPHPMGLSFFSFERYHTNVPIVVDFPTQAESGDCFAVLVEGNDPTAYPKAHHQIMVRRSSPRRISNAAGDQVTLKTFVCYQANCELLAGSSFCCIIDDDPQYHRTIAPVENACIPCQECTSRGRLAAEPSTDPTLFDLLQLKMHCIRMHAVAKPKPLHESFHRDVHRLACVLYRGFDTDCAEDDSTTIVAILRFLEPLDYALSALKLLKKRCVVDLLRKLFASEHLDEEETDEVVACLSWMRTTMDQQPVPVIELVSYHRPTKLQVVVHYDVECSNDARDAIHLSYAQHCISGAAAVVPRYDVAEVSTGYRSVIDFACGYVPVHLIDFPEVDVKGLKLVPMAVMEAIVKHDERGPFAYAVGI